MMCTGNKIFIDSSVLVEALKGNKVDFYQDLISNIDNEYFINNTVLSEYLYYILGFSSGVSPKSLLEKKQIQIFLSQEASQIDILKNFHFLKGDDTFLFQVPRLMALYNLLPNDAIVIATCKLHGITKLASHDSDFILPCKNENIDLLREE